MNKIQVALSLMSCMIDGGEQHSEVSRRAKDEAFEELNRLIEENERLRNGIAKESYEMEQVLGKALGYPAYKDDPKNFPNCTNDDVCVGEHVPASLAMEAADKIKQLENALKKEKIS